MSPEELYPWLVLWYAPNITPRRFHKILRHFKTLETFFKMEAAWEAFGVPEETQNYLKQPDCLRHIEDVLAWQGRPNCHILPFQHPDYPIRLKETVNPPLILFVKGLLKPLNEPQIAMVGSRQATPTGLELAHEFSSDLVNQGFTITSGLALGVDTAAHQGALSQGGHTIAVLGSGIERIYPAVNQKLSEEISEKGALISEFPLEASPKKEYFPQRNRVVSGLCLGTLVVEAGFKSGSLITARLAAEQGREVFAIPGSVRNPQAQGCHTLIQQGAKLVSKVEHVLEEFKGFHYGAHENKKPNLPSPKKEHCTCLEQKILNCLGYEPTPVDVIKARSGLDIAQVTQVLCSLRLKNEVESLLSGFIKIK